MSFWNKSVPFSFTLVPFRKRPTHSVLGWIRRPWMMHLVWLWALRMKGYTVSLSEAVELRLRDQHWIQIQHPHPARESHLWLLPPWQRLSFPLHVQMQPLSPALLIMQAWVLWLYSNEIVCGVLWICHMTGAFTLPRFGVWAHCCLHSLHTQ